jgi:hypothetical protein
VDQRNVAHPSLDNPCEIDIDDATAGVTHRRQPEVAG